VAAKKKTNKGPDGAATAADPRTPLPPGAEAWEQTLRELKLVLASVPPAAEPKVTDMVEAMLHIVLADGLPCGYGQEARRRIAASFVDRNEFRVTEAYEVEDLLRDLSIPNLFDRCMIVRDAVAQIYNDQNGVNLDFLREAAIGDRSNFFQRVPALPGHVVTFLNNLLLVDELCFSAKSTVRVQQKLSMEGNDAAQAFIAEVRTLLQPYGGLVLEVGKHLDSGKPNLEHALSPACVLVRLAPGGKKR